ncbi:MAG: site-specific integrase [Bryobacterales bacterium]|nr:site-specific integrase [Bryobacterales bacterium]
MEHVFKEHRLCEQDGPLGPYLDSYASEMRSDGYTQQTSEVQIRLVVDFGRWLAKQGIEAVEITAALFQPYLRARRRRRRPARHDLSALQRLLDLLVRQGVVAAPIAPAAAPADCWRSEFRLYLQQERALSSATQTNYLPFVGEFLKEHFGDGPVDLARLSAADVTEFVQRRAAAIQSRRVQLMTTALRSFLQFARYRGAIGMDLAACVPAVANWKLSAIPRAIPLSQVELVLASIDRKTVMGRRDYAILLILARLGLRSSEIKTLTLEDLDWQQGFITVRGKAGRYSQLPLPVDVGEAIADYLRHGRPTVSSRCLFVRLRAPLGGFKGQCGVGSVVRHALERAGIDAARKGAHQFRHALASQMLRQGASLSEIGELLRHRSPQTTAIYAKVDLVSLAALALPWPGGAQ